MSRSADSFSARSFSARSFSAGPAATGSRSAGTGRTAVSSCDRIRRAAAHVLRALSQVGVRQRVEPGGGRGEVALPGRGRGVARVEVGGDRGRDLGVVEERELGREHGLTLGDPGEVVGDRRPRLGTAAGLGGGVARNVTAEVGRPGEPDDPSDGAVRRPGRGGRQARARLGPGCGGCVAEVVGGQARDERHRRRGLTPGRLDDERRAGGGPERGELAQAARVGSPAGLTDDRDPGLDSREGGH